MTMEEVGSARIRLKVVQKLLVLCNRTLGNVNDSIHIWAFLLAHSVPMEGHISSWHLVYDLHNNSVSTAYL